MGRKRTPFRMEESTRQSRYRQILRCKIAVFLPKPLLLSPNFPARQPPIGMIFCVPMAVVAVQGRFWSVWRGFLEGRGFAVDLSCKSEKRNVRWTFRFFQFQRTMFALNSCVERFAGVQRGLSLKAPFGASPASPASSASLAPSASPSPRLGRRGDRSRRRSEARRGSEAIAWRGSSSGRWECGERPSEARRTA